MSRMLKANPQLTMKLKKHMPCLFSGLLFGAVAFVGFFIYGAREISLVDSSTAAIGYIFLPMGAALFALRFSIAGICAYYAKMELSRSRRSLPGYLAVAVACAILGYSSIPLVQTVRLGQVVNRVRAMPSAQFDDFLQNSPHKANKFALNALLESDTLTADQLYQIAQIPSSELHESMLQHMTMMGENKRGLAVMRLVAKHKNVDERTLSLLAESSNEYVRHTVATNSKTPVEILRRFFDRRDRDYLMDWGLAQNPNTPPDILRVLAGSSNEYTRKFASKNPGLKSDPEPMF